MSTAATLMSLLPQLKSMEHSIISMIVEIASKLATLTEAEIFVIVQDPDRRLIRCVWARVTFCVRTSINLFAFCSYSLRCMVIRTTPLAMGFTAHQELAIS